MLSWILEWGSHVISQVGGKSECSILIASHHVDDFVQPLWQNCHFSKCNCPMVSRSKPSPTSRSLSCATNWQNSSISNTNCRVVALAALPSVHVKDAINCAGTRLSAFFLDWSHLSYMQCTPTRGKINVGQDLNFISCHIYKLVVFINKDGYFGVADMSCKGHGGKGNTIINEAAQRQVFLYW